MTTMDGENAENAWSNFRPVRLSTSSQSDSSSLTKVSPLGLTYYVLGHHGQVRLVPYKQKERLSALFIDVRCELRIDISRLL